MTASTVILPSIHKDHRPLLLLPLRHGPQRFLLIVLATLRQPLWRRQLWISTSIIPGILCHLPSLDDYSATKGMYGTKLQSCVCVISDNIEKKNSQQKPKPLHIA